MLAKADSEWSPFYRLRIAHFEALEFDTTGGAAPVVNAVELRKQVLDAAEKGCFELIGRLTDSLPRKAGSGSGRLRPSRPREERELLLEASVPDGPARRARTRGLAVETLPAVAGLNNYLGCCCADHAKLPVEAVSGINRDFSDCTCGHPCPPEVASRLRENLDLLLGRPFITSGGNRYVPWFGRETLMVEDFPESDPDARTPLLEQLGITRRHGASRVVIENALLTNGPRLIRELDLDPVEFAVVCIPFDAYLRLAPKCGWGRQERWTHFDGYQVTRELRLWALVGGHVQFGGPEDMCGLGREYESDRLTARFAIIHRQRLLAREGGTRLSGKT